MVTVGGGFVGALFGLWSKRAAQAAVDVRPALANSGWVDAMFTGHLHDYLFFHHPTEMIAFNIIFMTVVFLVVWIVTIEW